MSIQGLGGVYGQQDVIPGARQPDDVRDADLNSGPGVGEAAEEAAHLQGPRSELPSQAPPGTDPRLWSVLTAEERRFFAQAHTMGPLTYDRASSNGAEPALQRGSRIDLRV